MATKNAKALKLMEELENATGASDWGGKEDVLGLLTHALRALDQMPAEAKSEAKDFHLSYIKKRLTYRLKVFQEIRSNPEGKCSSMMCLLPIPMATSLPVRSPIFIIGNPRTGSTLLHSLLGEDPLARCPRMWEMIYPLADRSVEDRVAISKEFIQDCYKQSPLLPVMHPVNPLGADECAQVLDLDLCSVPLIISLPKFRESFCSQPMSRKVSMYKFHKQMMQLLDFHNPKVGHQHWIFKSPMHTLQLKALREVYPDARFIWLHRDPVDVVSSSIAYWEAMAGWMFDEDHLKSDKIARGKRLLTTYSSMLNQCCNVFAEWKTEGFEPEVAHCHYKDLKRDPVETIKTIYKQLGCQFTPEFHKIIANKFEAMETSHKISPYTHSLTGYGITKDDIRDAYTPYFNACPAGAVYKK